MTIEPTVSYYPAAATVSLEKDGSLIIQLFELGDESPQPMLTISAEILADLLLVGRPTSIFIAN